MNRREVKGRVVDYGNGRMGKCLTHCPHEMPGMVGSGACMNCQYYGGQVSKYGNPGHIYCDHPEHRLLPKVEGGGDDWKYSIGAIKSPESVGCLAEGGGE